MARKEIALAQHPSGPGCALRLTVLRAPVLQPSHVPVALSPTYHRGPGIQCYKSQSFFFNFFFKLT